MGHRVRLSSRTFVGPRAMSQRSARTSVTRQSITLVSPCYTHVSLERRAHVSLGHMQVVLGHLVLFQDM